MVGTIVRIGYPRMALELSLKAMVLLLGLAIECRLDHGDEVAGHLFAVDGEAAFEKTSACNVRCWIGAMSKHSTFGGVASDLIEGIGRCNN